MRKFNIYWNLKEGNTFWMGLGEAKYFALNKDTDPWPNLEFFPKDFILKGEWVFGAFVNKELYLSPCFVTQSMIDKFVTIGSIKKISYRELISEIVKKRFG